MKKILKYISIVTGLFLTSCSLDFDQPDYVLDQNVLETVNDANLVIIGAYGQMPSSGPISVSANISDETRISSENRGQGVQIHSWSINSSTDEVSSNWILRFRPILNANKLLEKASNISVENEAERTLLDQYIAEAYAIRGYMHFELLRFYADYNNLDSEYGIPYVEKSGIDTPARLSVSDSYDKIEADLLKAYSLMPLTFDDNSRITKNGVRAILSRLYLYKRDYQNAIKYSTELISTMNLNTRENYSEIWTDKDETEVIFTLMKVPGDGAIGELFNSNNGDIMYHPSYDLMNLVAEEENDVRSESLFSTSTSGDPIVFKYFGTETNPGLQNVKLFRLSEQYLIRSEAYAQVGKLDLSAEDYNTLRRNRIYGVSDVVFNSTDAAINNIIKERRIELAYEGHRWFDLRRYNIGISRIDEDIVLVPQAKELPATDPRFKYFPIPQDEIFANDNMKQNEGF